MAQIRYHELARYGRKVAVGLVGGVVLAAGVAMLVLPGPGLVVVAAGLAILAIEFAWAQRARRRVEHRARKLAERAAAAHAHRPPRVDPKPRWRHGRLVAPASESAQPADHADRADSGRHAPVP